MTIHDMDTVDHVFFLLLGCWGLFFIDLRTVLIPLMYLFSRHTLLSYPGMGDVIGKGIKVDLIYAILLIEFV